MNTPSAVILLALLVSDAAGAEKSQVKSVPQPRPRLDPVSRAAMVLPPAPTKEATKVPAVVMEKFIVKEPSATPKGPSHLAENKGTFSAFNGGYVFKGDAGQAQWEIGAWPWLPWTDIMSEDSIKFPKPRTRIDIGIVRMHR